MEKSWETSSERLLRLVDRARQTGAWTRIILSRLLMSLMPASLRGRREALPNRFDDRREDRRLRVDRSLTCYSDKLGARNTHLINISTGGMYLETDSPLDAGQELSFNLLGMNLGPFLRARGQVTRRAEHGMAVRFI